MLYVRYSGAVCGVQLIKWAGTEANLPRILT